MIGAEVFSRMLDFDDRTTCVLFGDGAGAVVLEASETPGILATKLHADGRHLDILCTPGHRQRRQDLRRSAAEDGRPGGVQAGRRRARATSPTRCSRWPDAPTADIDWLVPHQANIRIMQSTARKLKLRRGTLVVTVDEHGNTSAASIPLALDVAVRAGQIQRGDSVAARRRRRRLHLGRGAASTI